jgi:cytochrome c oxidase subunit 2
VPLVVLAVLFAGGGTAVAVLLPWLPTAAALQASEIDPVIWMVVGIAIFIFAIVAAMIVYSVFAFRAPPDDDSDGPPVHGHTGLEILWTAIPTALVVAIGIYSAIVVARLDKLPRHHLTVDVIAQQFAWTFKYPSAGGISSGELYLPLGEATLLRMTSLDVIHAFFVPQFRQNEDLVPGLTTTLIVTPTRLGTYPVICNELCGLGHALMRSEAIVMPDKAFAAWEKSQSAAISSPSPSVAGAAIFKNNGCGACHTLTAAGASGKVGPDLDTLPQWAAEAKQPLAAFVRTSIVSPNAYIQPGYPKNVMPQTFATALSKQQLNALVQYLIRSSKNR